MGQICDPEIKSIFYKKILGKLDLTKICRILSYFFQLLEYLDSRCHWQSLKRLAYTKVPDYSKKSQKNFRRFGKIFSNILVEKSGLFVSERRFNDCQ